MAVETIYQVKSDHIFYFWRIRIFSKATILSLAHLSPIALIVCAIIVDFTLIFCEYRLTLYSKHFKITWLTANICTNIALILVVFVPIVVLSLLSISLLLIIAFICEAYMHHQEMNSKDRFII